MITPTLTSASQNAGITGMSHHTWPPSGTLIQLLPSLECNATISAHCNLCLPDSILKIPSSLGFFETSSLKSDVAAEGLDITSMFQAERSGMGIGGKKRGEKTFLKNFHRSPIQKLLLPLKSS
ncbi:hypothetical protein AAY473_012092 [Plecturocebus cupreus]